MPLTHEQMKKLQGVRHTLIGTGMFCFEKGDRYFLYREVKDARNVLVLVRGDIDDFVRQVNKQVNKDRS